jgi:tRNA1Val (adenine37-N6)-methyltransferase
MPDILDREQLTLNHFYKRKVVVYQGKKGYRFSVDAPVLADFLPTLPDQPALEIGTGSGIVSLLTLYKNKFSRVDAIELQPRLAAIARLNASENGFEDKLFIREGNLDETYSAFSNIPNIFSNPPYVKTGNGRLSPVEEIRLAKFEVSLTVKGLMERARAMLAPRGSLYMILPYDRFDEITAYASQAGYWRRQVRRVFSFKDGPPDRFLIQLTNYEAISEEIEPLIIFKDKGVYTEEMEKIFAGR